MHVDTALPCMADYIYLLQIIIPGFIMLIREEDYDEYETKTTRILPDPKWIEERQEKLGIILGGDERFDSVLSAAKDQNRAFAYERSRLWSSYDQDSEDEMKDLTACDKECGYCGRCDY